MAIWNLRWTRGPNPFDVWQRQAISEPPRPYLTVSCSVCRTGATLDSFGVDDFTAVTFVHCCGTKESVPHDIKKRIRAGK